jgi:hypothetical protein
MLTSCRTSDAVIVIAIHLRRCRWDVIVPFSAAVFALLAASGAIVASHYADTAVFVASGSVMAHLGHSRVVRSRSVQGPITSGSRR